MFKTVTGVTLNAAQIIFYFRRHRICIRAFLHLNHSQLRRIARLSRQVLEKPMSIKIELSSALEPNEFKTPVTSNFLPFMLKTSPGLTGVLKISWPIFAPTTISLAPASGQRPADKLHP